MNKQEFLTAIRSRLYGLPQSDLQKSLDYYSEMIDDRMEDGLSEEEAVKALGSIDEIVQQILMETPLPALVKEKTRPSRRIKGWEIALLILGSPIWLPLLFAALVVILAVVAVCWCAILVLYIADLCFATGTVAGVVCAGVFIWSGYPVQAVILLGAGLICLGLTILWFFVCNKIVSLTLRANKWIMLRVKSRFIRKEEVL